MTTFDQEWVASRRQFILRLLVEVGGEANESVLFKGVQHGGFARDSRDTVRQDLDHLKQLGCTTEDWLNDTLRVVTITERGEDAAYGRIDVAGVERSRWARK
jgi:hypothetical protein